MRRLARVEVDQCDVWVQRVVDFRGSLRPWEDALRELNTAVREDAAVGIATGASLAGRRAVVLMQNSGLGTALNALASLNILYKIPLLLLVSWRGYQGQDAPEHLLMGEVCTSLLDTVKIPYRVPEVATLAPDITWARETLERTQVPMALFVRKGIGE